MSEAIADPVALLAVVTALTGPERLPWLRKAGDLEATLVALGDASEQLAAVELARSLAATEVVIALADEANAARAQARGRRARAMALAYAGRFHEALAAATEAAALAERGGHSIEAARGRLASVNALASLGRFTEAIAVGETAREALLAAGEPALAARADVNIGATYDMQDDPARALLHYDRARPGLASDPVALAQLETNRGTALQGLDQFVPAEAAFRNAVADFEASGLGWAAAIAEGNLAHLATRQGRLEQALHHFERARRFLEADDSPAQLARLLAEQAQALTQLGVWEDAMAAAEEALPQLEDFGFASEAAVARFALGQALGAAGRMADADATLGGAAAAFAALAQPVMQARVDIARAAVVDADGRPGEAETLLTDALATLAARPVDVITARAHLARLALGAGDLAGASAHLAVVMPVAEQLDLAPLLADLLHLRALVARARGQDAAALDDLRAAVARIERLRGALPAERFRTAFFGNRLAAYEALVTVLLDQDDSAAMAEAFAVAEQAKSRALLDLVSGALDLTAATADAAEPAEAALLAELGRLSAELNWSYSRLDALAADGAAGLDPGWGRTIRQRERALEALQGRIAAGRGITGLYAAPLDLAAVQALLPADTALVEFFIAGEELLAFVVRRDQATALRRLATRSELTELARQIRFQISRAIVAGRSEEASGLPDGGRAERLLRDVRRVLGDAFSAVMAPALAAAGAATTLCIVPHGPLHLIPFNALWDGERFLVECYQIHYVPSASLLGRWRQDASAARRRALVVGVPDELAPQIEVEATRVAATLDTDQLLLGAEATIERVVSAAAEAGLVHLACHGRFVPETPLASGLKLGDGWLTARHLYGLRLGPRLVTLSGCDTGRGVISGGDELVGLMRAFFVAGASTVVMSLWTVNDESTAGLMTDFYAAWQGGTGAAGALRFAQLRGLAARPHPAFWAPFLLGGMPG